MKTMNSTRLYFVHLLMRIFPPTRCYAIKRQLLRWCGAVIGENVRIVSSAKYLVAGKLSIGNDTWICHDVMFIGGESVISIGSKVDIAPRVLIVTGTHEQYSTNGRAAGAGT